VFTKFFAITTEVEGFVEMEHGVEDACELHVSLTPTEEVNVSITHSLVNEEQSKLIETSTQSPTAISPNDLVQTPCAQVAPLKETEQSSKELEDV